MVARGGDRDGVEPTAPDAVRDPARREAALEQAPERRGVEEAMRARATEQRAEREVEGEPGAGPRQAAGVAREDVLDAQVRPEARELARGLAEAGAARREQRAVDGARRGAGDDGEGRGPLAQARHLAEAREHAGLIGAARAAGGEHETEHR